MNVLINYKKKPSTNRFANLIFFVDEKFSTNRVGKNLSSKEIYFINDLIKSADLKKKILIFGLSSNKNVKGLPKQVELSEGQFFVKIDNL